MSSEKNAIIKELPSNNNGYLYVVEVEGELWYLSSLVARKKVQVGDKGIITYVPAKTAGYYWSWKKVRQNV